MDDLNKQELRRLAEAVVNDPRDGIHQSERIISAFDSTATPEAILSLLDEIAALRDELEDVTADRDGYAYQRDQLRAEVGAYRKQLKALIHISDATQWEQHTCGEIAKARALLAGEGNANG